MSFTEIYYGQDGSWYKTKRLSENPIFFRYEELSEEERKSLADLLHNNSSRIESKAGSFGYRARDPAADDSVSGLVKHHHETQDRSYS
jgi:hypothetical protein